jgi:hypothetical protein
MLFSLYLDDYIMTLRLAGHTESKKGAEPKNLMWEINFYFIYLFNQQSKFTIILLGCGK